MIMFSFDIQKISTTIIMLSYATQRQGSFSVHVFIPSGEGYQYEHAVFRYSRSGLVLKLYSLLLLQESAITRIILSFAASREC